MMLNQSKADIEGKPEERTLTTTHSVPVNPAAWQTPGEAGSPCEKAETTVRLPSNGRTQEVAGQNRSRKTKIIATLGPASDNGGVLRSLVEAGVSVFRLNLACSNRQSLLKAVFGIRALSAELQRPVSLLLDTQSSVGRLAGAPAISESDWADIRFGLECGVDWLAVSDNHAGDAVRLLRQFLAEQKKNNISILVRIQDPAPLATLDQIIQDADGIILDSSRLADERPDEKGSRVWQLVWHQIVQKCVSARKLAVIATDANLDVASILFSAPDALLLTSETSFGSNPLQSVQTLDNLIRRVESEAVHETSATVTLTSEQDQAVAAAVQQANEMPAEAVVILTQTGNSAALCAALRPHQSRVFVFTPNARLARSLRLRYALETFVLPFSEKPKANRLAAEKILQERKVLASGARTVCITD